MTNRTAINISKEDYVSKRQNIVKRKHVMAISAAAGATLLLAQGGWGATTYTWGSANTGGNWSGTTNWSPTAATNGPGGTTNANTDIAVLDTASANRTVIYDSTNSYMGTLKMNQTSGAYANVLEMQRAAGLTILNPLTLGSTTGTTRLFYNANNNTTTSSGTLIIPSLTLNSGGVLEFSNYGNGTYYNQDSLGKSGAGNGTNVTINGGTLQINQVVANLTSAQYFTNIYGPLSMTSGTITFGVHAPDGFAAAYYGSGGLLTTQDRLAVIGNLNITGGTFIMGGTVTSGTGTNHLYLNGATNVITGLSTVTLQKDPTTNSPVSNYNTNNISALLHMGGSNASLQSDSSLTGGIYLANVDAANTGSSWTVSLGTYTSGNTLTVGQIGMGVKYAGNTEILKLIGNVSSGYIISNAATAPGANSVYGIDTNGYTLDLSTASVTNGFEVYSAAAANLSLTNSQGSSAAGVIKAKFYNLAYQTGGSSVGSYVNLTATGSGGLTNNLGLGGGSGTIDPTSTFTYNGTATTSNYDKLVSSRTIGNLVVKTGALQLGSAITTGSGSSVMVNSGATLDLGGYALNTGSLVANGTVNVGTFALASGQTLKGSGTVTGNVTVASGSMLAPGNSPGTLTETGSATYAGGGTYVWEINDTAGTAGANPGWDKHVISGSLSITASSGDKFVIDITSLNGITAGDTANFVKTSNYDWTIASAAGGISGFDANSFQLLTSHFSNDITGSGSNGYFTLRTENSGTTLNLVYNAAVIPEPATAALVALSGMAGLLIRPRRRAAAAR